MSKTLFNDFGSVSAKQWKQKIQADLKGADYNNTLIWNTNEDINVKPFYHSDDFKDQNLNTIPANGWSICQTIYVANAEKSNANAIDAINRGADSIKFIIANKAINVEVLLKNIDSSKTPLHFDFETLDANTFTKLKALIDLSTCKINIDSIGHLAKEGNWFTNLTEDHNTLESSIKLTNQLSINTTTYQNAGATIVQQLGYALAHANEYLNHCNTLLSQSEKESLKVTFNVAVGTNYFFEIAKLRALRMLWRTLALEYNVNPNCFVFAQPTKRNKTLYDYNTNMLRTTTECMSAILGGANTISNTAYDAIYHKTNEFGERIARNQLLILKNESYFDYVENASEGSYYIESLTQQLSQKALDLFKTIEDNGGFLQQLKEGKIQKKIKESAAKEQHQFDTAELVLLGTNKHPNTNDKMASELELFPFVKIKPRKTLIEPIIEKRLAEIVEQNRLKTE
ncbi:methylmalonyl-CoA mutase subunit beta [Lacinutrix salivirga]